MLMLQKNHTFWLCFCWYISVFVQGFVTAVNNLRTFVPAIYDCTYAVPKSEASPTLLRIFKGISCSVSQLKTLTKAKWEEIHNAVSVIQLLLFLYYDSIILFIHSNLNMLYSHEYEWFCCNFCMLYTTLFLCDELN